MIAEELEIVAWLGGGGTGASSKTMALAALGLTYINASHPLDPADFNRCLSLVRAAPLAKRGLKRLALSSEKWETLATHWDELEELFESEVGEDWTRGSNAKKTYKRMKDLGL